MSKITADVQDGRQCGNIPKHVRRNGTEVIPLSLSYVGKMLITCSIFKKTADGDTSFVDFCNNFANNVLTLFQILKKKIMTDCHNDFLLDQARQRTKRGKQEPDP